MFIIYHLNLEVMNIKHYKSFYIGAIVGGIITITYALNKNRNYNIEKIIQTKVNNAKMTFNNNEIYGYWIMKKSNYWVGAINIKKDEQIIEHPFVINDKYQLSWQED